MLLYSFLSSVSIFLTMALHSLSGKLFISVSLVVFFLFFWSSVLLFVWNIFPCLLISFSDLEIEPTSLMSPALADRFFTSSAAWETPVKLGKAVTCPSLEGVSLCRRVLMPSVCTHWLWFGSWIRSEGDTLSPRVLWQPPRWWEAGLE